MKKLDLVKKKPEELQTMLTDLKKELFTLAFFFKASSPAKEAD
jgi:ribosomal protein L29